MFHFIFMPFLVMVLVFAIAVRILTRAVFGSRSRGRQRGSARGWGDRYGYGRPYGAGRGFLTLLAIVAIERLFGRRYY